MKYRLIFLTIVLFSYSAFVHATPKRLTIGIFPYASTSKLVSHHKNIKKHLNKSGRYNVSLVTASDLPTYMENLKNFKYDLIYSAPHVARFMEKEHGYQRVAMTTHRIRGVVITRKDSPIHKFGDLKGKILSMAPAKTILHQITLKQLEDKKIIPDKDIKIKVVNTHSNAIFNVINNESDAAITGVKLWKKLAKRHKGDLRKVSLTDPTTGFIVLAKPGVKHTTVKDLTSLLISFNNTLAGKSYLFKGFKAIDDESMKSLDFHARVFSK